MSSSLRACARALCKSFGTAGLVVIFAIVVTSGSALAADDGSSAGTSAKKKGQAGLNSKQKKEVEAIAKKAVKPGPTGPVGPTGPQGPKGDAGAKGADGSNGLKGATGKQGVAGAAGAKGATGKQGVAGAAGAKGATGAASIVPGPAGATGVTGPKGATGFAAGPPGPTGAAGPTGSGGPAGAAGPTGAEGPTGPPGGPTGATGPTGPSGEGEGELPNPITGVWSVNGEEGNQGGTVPLQVSISYLQKIEPAPKLAFVLPGGQEGMLVNTATGVNEQLLGNAAAVETRCGTSGAGAVADPDAEPGFLCFFVGTQNEVLPADFGELFFPPEQSDQWISPAPESGAIIPFSLEEDPILETPPSPGGYAQGSWAVGR